MMVGYERSHQVSHLEWVKDKINWMKYLIDTIYVKKSPNQTKKLDKQNLLLMIYETTFPLEVVVHRVL